MATPVHPKNGRHAVCSDSPQIVETLFAKNAEVSRPRRFLHVSLIPSVTPPANNNGQGSQAGPQQKD